MIEWLLSFEEVDGWLNIGHIIAWLAISLVFSLLARQAVFMAWRSAVANDRILSNRHIKLAILLLIWFTCLMILGGKYADDPMRQRLVVAFQSLAFLSVAINLALYIFPSKKIERLLLYSIAPLIVLNFLDLLDPIIQSLDSYAINTGETTISLYDIVRVLYFTGILLWFGRESNRVVKQKIRTQNNLDSSTKEIIAKLFEVGFITAMLMLMLNIIGVNIATLALLGGALGVGLGFGLQSIASNFVSGLIILMDRSLSIGDYIELDSGMNGIIRELNLRAVTLETYDGKDVVVPNDVFFSETFTNWTHKNNRQRYAIEFSVAYSTDLDRLFPLVKEMLCENPEVLSGPDYSIAEQPDIEISSFGDNGIELLIEFWMDAVDDGDKRVGADINYALWKLINSHGFEFPFPQREVRILNQGGN
ncbi:mechanosensitive ion channel family protein [Reinekea marinisedimentorum]|uniref:Mechanosensitive ion channel-like protein n=1 Tax=Reinekea marinisedimentorum TaxID=230495 RepID=A0A4R3IB74_9GAMM|nr:mechanosensitive ion channel domain-containing protein [Reinekea marinisedimentorum]TCS42700.1 mechanosensitive ion channel-like protein [Reinekea marinisedimentorum]